VITADDFGFGVSTSLGIVHAYLHGPVNRTSMMVVSEDHAKASVQLLDETPNLNVGLHLVFTNVGHRALAATPASGLVNSQRRFFSIPQLYFRCISGRIDASAVFDEICAQARLFHKLTGRTPTHVDGHHHAHQFPVIRQAMIGAMNAGLLPRVTRRTVEAPGMLKSVASRRTGRIVLNALGQAASVDFRREGIDFNDHFFGVLNDHDLAEENPWEQYLAALPPHGAVEWMVHPGFYDESLIGRDSYIHQLVLELSALTGPSITAQPAIPSVRSTPNNGAFFARINATGIVHGHGTNHRLSFVRREESNRPPTP
jgi:predicted glycoside hydrolase/deacetylase ChbG (UPF0249 family)